MGSVEVIVGNIVRPHGVHGEVLVLSRTDEPERRFAVGTKLRVEGRPGTLSITASHRVQGRLILSFAELPTRDEAEEARGWVLLADVADDETPTSDEEYYDRQLIGLRVLRHDGREAGVVKQVLHPGVQDLLVVSITDAPDAPDALVPFVLALVPDVDLAAGTLTLADIAGLIDEPDALDEPDAAREPRGSTDAD
ncbi:MAG: ribosome maturation factor RimM [Propionibacteriaceae bacterium]|jgi:16S rRNA processing protein RimM|nr:ribosome maturation factor RimM [Propionibacteriaceae bacterium]